MVEKLNPENARQGQRGKPVLWVLIGSLALLAVATVGLLTWNGANSPKDYASQSQDASRREITGSVNGTSGGTSPSNSSKVPADNPAYPQPAQPANSGTAK
jgi:flagellar basal body-associated protein FliL